LKIDGDGWGGWSDAMHASEGNID